MNELTTDLKSLHEATLNNLKNSKANNTLRAYKSDFKDFAAFCNKHSLNSLPTEPKIISIYLTHLSKNSKISTLRRRLVSISMIHKIKGIYLDTKHPIIVENLMGIKRVKGSIQKGKKPLLINHLKSIINLIDELKVEEIKKLRDKSIILLGFGGGFRRNELISIDHEDLEFVPEGLKIVIRRSKTDQFGEGMVKGLPYFTNEVYCPVFNLKKWLEISKIKSGPIFRRFNKGSSLTSKRLTDQTVVILMKKYLKLAGIENKDFAGHSLRSGFATVAAESGADERSIMAMTGHKTTQMVRRYIKEANIFKNNALNKIKI
ncbi:MAG: site-specific integrase [Candidatus Pelagibacter sp.]|tara:strand:- start:886 stop:1839 length:954 start_codon:yes stop_codon:yes gene_type:complete